jgi:DNA-binding transcriptional ArsR family regulator
MSGRDVSGQVAVLAALAQGTRLRILERLANAGSAGLSAGEIARALRCPASTLSFHLKELDRAGLIEAQPAGRQVYYQIHRPVLRALAYYLAGMASHADDGRRRGGGAKDGARRTDGAASSQLAMFSD